MYCNLNYKTKKVFNCKKTISKEEWDISKLYLSLIISKKYNEDDFNNNKHFQQQNNANDHMFAPSSPEFPPPSSTKTTTHMFAPSSPEFSPPSST